MYENKGVRAIERCYSKITLDFNGAFRCPIVPRRGKPLFFHGQWFRAIDSNGIFHAQPDFYLHFKDRILVFEFKLSRCQSAEYQLLDLYGPLLHKLFHLPLVYISCFSNPGPDYVVYQGSPKSLEDCFNLPLWSFNEWHLRL